MKRYKLKKDLPTFKAGRIFILADCGDLYAEKETPPEFDGDIYDVVAYSRRTLAKFPNILTDWFEEIPDKPKTVWDLKDGDKYYFIADNGVVRDSTWYDCDIKRREVGDAFLTKEEAEKELAWRKARAILQRDAKGFKPDWKECNFGWGVSYSVMDKEPKLETDWLEWADGTIRFATEEDAKASIKAHEKEWKIYLGVEG